MLLTLRVTNINSHLELSVRFYKEQTCFGLTSKIMIKFNTQKLLKYMADNKLTHFECSVDFDISYYTFRDFFTKKYNGVPRINTLYKMAKGINCTIEELLIIT